MNKRFIVTLGVIFIVVSAIIPSVYFFLQYQKTQRLLANPQEAAKEEIKTTIEKINKLAEVPSGEDPTVATVNDMEKLQGQAFFSKAQNGDKVIVYPQSKKAILYRPSTNRIVEMAPVNVPEANAAQPVVAGATAPQNTPTSQTPSQTPAKVNKIAIYNGTTTPRLANSLEGRLTTTPVKVEVVSKTNAAKQDYAKSIIVDLSGSSMETVKTLSQLVNADITTLPAGETKPEGDILIIIGANYTP